VSTDKLVIVNGAVVPQPCGLYAGHTCAMIENHHICPKSWFLKAGKPVTTPMALICPTCHSNVHAGIDALLLGRDIHQLPPRCQALARQALAIAAEQGLPTGPTSLVGPSVPELPQGER
jgi:hypothetical protein